MFGLKGTHTLLEQRVNSQTLLNKSCVTVGLKDVPEEMQKLALCFIFGLQSCAIMSHALPNDVGVCVCLSVLSNCVCLCVCVFQRVCVFVIKLP